MWSSSSHGSGYSSVFDLVTRRQGLQAWLCRTVDALVDSAATNSNPTATVAVTEVLGSFLEVNSRHCPFSSFAPASVGARSSKCAKQAGEKNNTKSRAGGTGGKTQPQRQGGGRPAAAPAGVDVGRLQAELGRLKRKVDSADKARYGGISICR